MIKHRPRGSPKTGSSRAGLATEPAVLIRVYTVPIRPFLTGQSFDPELIEDMSAALVRACEALELRIMDDPATRLVARTIIELAQRGLRDEDGLVEMTLREFGVNEKCDGENGPQPD